MELVDTRDLKSLEQLRAGSSPAPGTNYLNEKKFNKIKVAIVGIGAIANRHIEAISCHSTFIEIESICDLNNEALKKKKLRKLKCKGLC